MSKHTPGPWHRSTFRGGYGCIRTDDDVTVATFGTGNRADADLIAAAPDMLEALKAVAIIRNGWPEVFDRVDAAVAKAEGETP